MDTEATRAAVTALFKAGWVGTLAASIPVEYPNQKFKQPESGHWGRLSMQLGDRDSVAIGATRKRQMGILTLQIFAPEEAGTSTAYKAADLFADIVDLKALTPATGLVIEFELAGVAGPFESKGFSQINAQVAFRVDKTT
jgi:hypothetical protein